MDVYVVEFGMKHEGGGVESVHATFESAYTVAKERMDKERVYWEEARADQVAAGEEVSDFDKTFGVYEEEDPLLDEGEERLNWTWSECAHYVSIRKMPVLE